MNKDESEFFITEFPKEGCYLNRSAQGRVQFTILDQIKLMKTPGMKSNKIKNIILDNVQNIIENYQF